MMGWGLVLLENSSVVVAAVAAVAAVTWGWTPKYRCVLYPVCGSVLLGVF